MKTRYIFKGHNNELTEYFRVQQIFLNWTKLNFQNP